MGDAINVLLKIEQKIAYALIINKVNQSKKMETPAWGTGITIKCPLLKYVLKQLNFLH
jgi:hypothetical protein